ncbi:MAG: hypothetical protein V1243_00570, partial [Arenicellales bacterium]|nr:hypothetical protein [Arenicellales bacterium]
MAAGLVRGVVHFPSGRLRRPDPGQLVESTGVGAEGVFTPHFPLKPQFALVYTFAPVAPGLGFLHDRLDPGTALGDDSWVETDPRHHAHHARDHLLLKMSWRHDKSKR